MGEFRLPLRSDFARCGGQKFYECCLCGAKRVKVLVHFDSGSVEPTVGETITGETSADTCIVEGVKKISGVWSSSNLVTNGGFSSSSGWTVGTGWSISGGVATQSDPEHYGALSQEIGIVVGKTYRVSYTISDVTHGGNFYVTIGDATPDPEGGAGTYTHDLTPAMVGPLMFSMNDEFMGSVDDVSVYDLTGDVVGVIEGNTPTGYDDINLEVFQNNENLNGSVSGANFATVNGIGAVQISGRLIPDSDIVEYNGKNYCRNHFRFMFEKTWADSAVIDTTKEGDRE
jgi:hypothetical protein